MLDLGSLDMDVPAGASGVAAKAPIARFEEDPNQPRTEFDAEALKTLADDIREHGILQPVIVTEQPDGKLRIRFGARRLRAAKLANLAELPYVLCEDERQLDDYSQVSENEQRANLTPRELAVFVARKVSGGEKRAEVARRLNIDPSAVTHLLALADPPAFIDELYQSGKCRLPVYLYELRKLHEKDADRVEARCAAAEEITRKFISALAQEIKGQEPPPPTGPDTVKDALDQVPPAGGSSSGGSSTSGGSSEFASTESGGDADGEGAGVQVQQVPSHNPEIEKGEKRPADPNKIRKPLLLANYKPNGADTLHPVMLVLDKRPSSAGLVHIRYEDGSGDAEVSLDLLTLTLLSESTA